MRSCREGGVAKGDVERKSQGHKVETINLQV